MPGNLPVRYINKLGFGIDGMRAIIFFALGLLLLSYGCIDTTTYQGIDKERTEMVKSEDIDGDGSPDALVYDFKAVERGSKTISRQMSVAIKTRAEYTEMNDVSDLDLINADNELMEYIDRNEIRISECARKLGIESIRCIDPPTCMRLCEGTSLKCRNVADRYGEALGGSIMAFQGSSSDFESDIISARNDVLGLRDGNGNKKNLFLNSLRDSVFRMASINANPVIANSGISLCNPRDFDVGSMHTAAKTLGNYTVSNESYSYIITITVESSNTEGNLGSSLETIELEEQIPAGALGGTDELSSPHRITTLNDGGMRIQWAPEQPSDEGYMMMYSFSSTMPPEEMAGELRSPELTVKSINLSALAPIDTLFLAVHDITGNYYLSLGFSLSIILVVLMVIYSIAILAVSILRAKAAGQKTTTGIRRALGRTNVSWRLDIIIGIVLMMVAVFAAGFQAVEPAEPTSILDMDALSFMLSEWWGSLGMICGFFGLLMTYMAVENLSKIMILERTYGVAIKEEKELFEMRRNSLIKRMGQLKELLDEVSELGFDLGPEYDVLASVKADKIKESTKEMNQQSKKLVDEDLSKIERAIEKVKQKQKMAEENWPEWEKKIKQMLAEEGEVLESSLGSIPSSLRPWVMAKYAKEHKAGGITFDGTAIRKKEVKPEKLLDSFLEKGLYSGIIVIKNDRVIMARMAQGSATVPQVLALKLRTYLAGLSKHLELGNVKSFASIGSKTVVVLMKNEKFESMLFVQKSKFKEAIETWKEQGDMVVE